MLARFTRCSCRHLLSDHQTWPIAATLLSRTYRTRTSAARQPISPKIRMKNRRSAIICIRPAERHIDRSAREAYIEVLHGVLTQHKGVHGLTSRPDTYVSVRELLDYRHFRALSFSDLQKVVNEDQLHRFELLYQPLKGRDGDSWWIRVKGKEEKDVRLDPIIFSDNIGTAIYGTTLQDWRSHISLYGISRRSDNYIQIFRGVTLQDYFSSPTTTEVLIYIDIKHAINMGIRFFLSSRPSPFSAPPLPSLPHLFQNRSPTPTTSGNGTSSLGSHSSVAPSNSPSRTTHSGRQIQPPPRTKSPTSTTYKFRSTQIVTPGNEFGFLPPECFTRVEVVRVKTKVLWTLDEEPDEAAEQDQSDKGSDTEDVKKYVAVDTKPERGYRTDQVTEKYLDQFFVDLPTDHQVSHSELKKEALTILSI